MRDRNASEQMTKERSVVGQGNRVGGERRVRRRESERERGREGEREMGLGVERGWVVLCRLSIGFVADGMRMMRR